MGRISIELPDALLVAARSKAQQGGYESVESYLTALLESEVALSDEALEAMLTRRLEDPRPSIDATDGFWQEVNSKVRAELELRNRAAS
jgi:uncharacterized protein HemY